MDKQSQINTLKAQLTLTRKTTEELKLEMTKHLRQAYEELDKAYSVIMDTIKELE